MKRVRAVTVENDLTLLATTFAVYLNVVYAFSFSQNFASARYANHLAILMMDALIFTVFLRSPLRFVNNLLPRRGFPWEIRLFRLLALGSFLFSVLLQADYLFARHRGVEDAGFGTLAAVKGYVVLSQVAFVVLFTLARLPGEFRVPVRSLVRTDLADIMLFSPVLVPLINYFSRNRGEFTLLSAMEYFVVFLIFPFLVMLFAQAFQRVLGARSFAVPVVMALTFVYYSLPMVSAALGRPVETLFLVHLSLACIVPGLVAAAYQMNRQVLLRAMLFFSLGSVAASFALPGSMSYRERQPPSTAIGADTEESPSPVSHLVSAPLKRRPDVYILIYDGYASSAMLKRYGLDNDSLAEYLLRNKFVSYEHAYSVFPASLGSMESLMDMRAPARVRIGDANTVNQFFKEHGYRIYLVLNAYLLNGSDRIVADFVFPSLSYRSGLGALYRGIVGGEFKSEIVFQDSTRDEWLSVKRTALAEQRPEPKMLYAHSGFPGHSQNSGSCLQDETERYAARLTVANEEMRVDIETILASRRDAIVVVAGDHGPYLTGDCLYMTRYRQEDLSADHLADRYGAALAIRWPDAGFTAYDRISTIQDVFFAISAYMLEDTRVLRYKPPAETFGYGGIPDGAVKNGVVMIGQDRGHPLP